jgi:hypothetical protein
MGCVRRGSNNEVINLHLNRCPICQHIGLDIQALRGVTVGVELDRLDSGRGGGGGGTDRGREGKGWEGNSKKKRGEHGTKEERGEIL